MIDEEIRRRADARYGRLLRWLAAGMVVAAVVGVATAMAQDDDLGPRRVLIGLAIALAVAVIPIGVLFLVIHLLRRRGGPFATPSPLLGVARPTRRRVGRSVRTGRHLTGQEEELALETARRTLRARWFVWFFPVMAVLQVVLWLADDDHSTLRTATTVLWIVLGVVAPVLGTVSFRRARAYLAEGVGPSPTAG